MPTKRRYFPKFWLILWGVLFVACMAAVSGCTTANEYAGINYGTLETPAGEKWTIAGGKDETDVKFSVTTSPDGTRAVEYSASSANASSVIAAQAAQQQQLLEMLNKLLERVDLHGV